MSILSEFAINELVEATINPSAELVEAMNRVRTEGCIRSKEGGRFDYVLGSMSDELDVLTEIVPESPK